MKTQLRKFTMIIMLAAIFSCNSFAQDGRTPTLTKTFEMNEPGTLHTRSSGGGIDVYTNDQHKVVVQLFVRKYGKLLDSSDPDLKEILDDFDMDIAKDGSVITAIIERRSHFNFMNNTGISLAISVPREMSCNVSSSGGGVEISGVEGTHKFSSSGGGVRLENVSGYTEAKSSGGGVKVANQKGELHVSSSGGGVTVIEARGKVFAHSSGGGVKLHDIFGDAEAGSSGGGVTVTGEAGYVKAKSSGGSVHVDISNLSKGLDLQSSGGGVDATIHNGDELGLDLDLHAGRVNVNLRNFTGSAEKDRVKGSMNGGGIPVYMHASGGNVNLRF